MLSMKLWCLRNRDLSVEHIQLWFQAIFGAHIIVRGATRALKGLVTKKTAIMAHWVTLMAPSLSRIQPFFKFKVALLHNRWSSEQCVSLHWNMCFYLIILRCTWLTCSPASPSMPGIPGMPDSPVCPCGLAPFVPSSPGTPLPVSPSSPGSPCVLKFY